MSIGDGGRSRVKEDSFKSHSAGGAEGQPSSNSTTSSKPGTVVNESYDL